MTMQLVGGPAHGQVHVVDADVWDPPQFFDLVQWLGFASLTGDESVPTVRLRYAKELNRANDGPVWLYRFQEAWGDGE